MAGQRRCCFPGLSAAWNRLLLLLLLQLWLCVCTRLPAKAQGAILLSRSDALTQETRETTTPSRQKRGTNPAHLVDVRSIRVSCTVTSRFAHTVMTSTALNKANDSQEIHFEVEMPKTAFITNFSMEIEGEVYVGEVKEKEKAKKQYDKAVSSGQTAGLVKASGRTMEVFSVSVNIAANASVTFTLTYEELLRRKLGKYDIVTRVKPKQPVQDFQIVANIYEPQGITFVDASATFLTNELISSVEKTVTETKAYISFSPTLEQQTSCADCQGNAIDGDFIISYDVKRVAGLGEVQVVSGYFVHFFAPPDLRRVPKNVVFVIDRSGSMSGRKIVQTRDALVAILGDLSEEDHFALVVFDHRITYWRKTLSQATKEDVTKAVGYVKKIKHDGSTNINDAVLKAVDMLLKERKKKTSKGTSVDMIVLLTDGMPNSGESSLSKIQKNVQAAIGGNMSLFCLGFGNNVDYSFLDVMSRQNKGLARRIYEASDATVQLQGFFEEVSSPLLLEVDLRYPDNAVDSLTKNHFTQLFNGSEIVVSGRLSDNDLDQFQVEVLGQGTDKDFQAQGTARVADWNVTYPEQQYIFGDFAERLWAYLTIQQLLHNTDVGTPQEKAAAAARALNMSLQYSFVTPLTSMVVTKPQTEDGADSPLIADKLTESQRQEAERGRGSSPPARHPSRSASRRVSSASVRASRPRVLSDVDGDPHFLIRLPERKDSLCFNINDKPGTIFTLVKDPDSGFLVNGQIIARKKGNTSDNNTYFGRLGISHQKLGLRLEVTTQDISVLHDGRQVKLLWSDTASIKENNMDLKLTNNCSLTVVLRHFIKFTVIRHTKQWRRRGSQQDYLGFYTLDSHHMAPSAHGLLGQFYQGVEFEVAGLSPSEVKETSEAMTMYVKGGTVNVTRHWQKDFSEDVKNGESIPCWFVHNNGAGLIDGTASDYIVSGLFKTL